MEDLMKHVMLMDGPRSGEIVEVSDDASGVRDEGSLDWYRSTTGKKTVRVEIWKHAGPITSDDEVAR